MLGHGDDLVGVFNILERFQTGIVGLIGFAGVIITLFVNACITRRHANEARGHERVTLARALLTELSSHRRSVKQNLKDMEKANPEAGELLLPAIRETAVFDANVSHLGRLSAVQVGPVLEAYLRLKEFNRSIALFSTPDSTGHYQAVGGQDAPKVGHMLQSLSPHLDAAIAALGGTKDCKAVRPDD